MNHQHLVPWMQHNFSSIIYDFKMLCKPCNSESIIWFSFYN